MLALQIHILAALAVDDGRWLETCRVNELEERSKERRTGLDNWAPKKAHILKVRL